MINLRPYQNEAIDQLRNGFRKHQRQVLCSATGSGKTVIFSEMVRLADQKNTTTLVLTDRIELFKQTIFSLDRINIQVEEISPSKKIINTNATVFVAMVETLARRDLPINPTLIIIDEAHKASFNKIIERFPTAKVIGATATPVGKHFFKYYTNIVESITTSALIEQGFLVPCRPYQMEDDFSDLEVKAGEYTDKSLYNHYNKQRLYDGVIKEYIELAHPRKTIVFNVNIEHSENMAERFKEAGIMSESITSKTPKIERERILRAFQMGAFPVLNNCGILTTGYDEPTIECVIMNRKTKSLPLFLQCVGRGSRPSPTTNKKDFMVLDFGKNHDEHGLWKEDREWSINPPKKKKKDLGAAPVKKCPDCSAILAVSVKECEFCGHEFDLNTTSLAKGVMVEFDRVIGNLSGRKISHLSVDELLELERVKRYKSSFIWRVIRSKGEDVIRKYASIKKYKEGWIQRQILTMDDSNYNDYYITKPTK